MPISAGDSVPQVDSLWEEKPEQKVEFPASGKYIIVGVPGAFTPPCSDHVPGFAILNEDFTSKGYEIYILAVNDIFVLNAWKKHILKEFNADAKLHFVSDRLAEFSKAVGLSFDAAGLLGNERANRFVIVVEDGKVKTVKVETNPPDIELTKAENLLATL